MKYTARVIMKIPARFMTRPVLTISFIFSRLVPKTMAFGGVATGSINAIEADIVAGSMKRRGCVSLAIANPAKMGRIISVVAVLDVSSVRKVMNKAITAMIIIGW